MKKLLIPALLLLAITACKKKTEVSNPVTATNFKTYSSMDEVFALLASQPKVMIFDAAAGTSFYGNNGVRYIFQPNGFIDASGAVVTGNVQVEVTEYLKKGDMIFSGVLPVSNGLPLVSGGEFYVKATKNGQELFVNPGKSMQANLPQFGSKDTVMSMFAGNTNGGTGTNKVNWQIKEPDTSKINTRGATYFSDTVRMICDSFKFWNGDHFFAMSDLQNFQVKIVANGADLSSAFGLMGYTLFDTENSLMYLGNPHDNIYSANNIPKRSVHFIAFCLINGHFYGGVTLANPVTTGSTYTITLTEVDPKDFKAQINGLY